jgi:hypothetical protein
MSVFKRFRWQTRLTGAGVLAAALTLLFPTLAFANVSLTQISSDPFTQATCKANNATNHHTEVEPDTFSNGSTIVAAFQVGRVYDGGGCAIGFATTTNNGASWTNGLLRGITKWTTAQGTGPYDRVSDPAVAYDARHNVWLVSTLPLLESGGVHGAAIVTSRSTDGGLTWSNPVTTATGGDLDKNWIVCDNTATSPFYGHCYTQWDNHGAGNLLQMSASTDGGLTWGAAKTNNTGVIGGQPVVRPDGTVIAPIDNANETAVGAFHSTDGGATWSSTTTIATVSHHRVSGSLREGPLPSAEIDGAGTVYVAWADCRFRTSCPRNDIVYSKSTNSLGTTWSAVTRIPIDATTSTVDHFIPGLGVNKTTSGGSAHVGVTYYYYTNSACGSSCQLNVGFISSSNGGSTWSAAAQLTGPFNVGWTATTSQGRMVGDYISTSYGSDNLAHGVFATASTPTSGTTCSSPLDNCREPTSSPAAGLALSGSASGANDPVLFGGNGGDKSQSLWNVVDNNGSKHRD